MLGILLITLGLLGPQCNVIAEEDEHELASVSGYDNFEHNCDEPPPPLNGELLCGKHKKKSDRYVCKAQCDPGYQFPNKKTKSRHSCDLNTGEWSPKFEFPDCDPICSPPCENNGKCSEGNHCICTPKYRGDRCQYAVELCDPERGLGVSADWKCDDGAEETTCVMKCPQGTRYESPPADKYHCSLAGTWTPSFAPNCIPINVIEPPAANGVYSPVTNQLTSSGLPTSGVCAMWGTSHYRTFDGGVYSFQGPCTYVLAKDCAQNSFAIHIQNPKPCESAASCATTLAIYIGSEKYLLTRGQGGGPVVEKGDEVHPVPGEVQGLLFQLLSDYVTVKSSLGFSLKWNQKNTVLVKASPQLRNRTCGLCGKFDGSVLNDFETSDGSITDSVQGFVNSWTMDDLGERCEEKAVVRDACSEDKAKAIEAEALCSDILDVKFSACHELVDPQIYLEVCKMEHCACPFDSCYCGTLAEYFRECSRLGGKIDGGWRSDQLCPLSCPEGMIYKDCGSSCPRTCKGTLYDCEDNQCLDGCHCPEGMLLHDGRCIEHRECPCMHAGKEYPTGDTYKDGCNACECNGGEWQCTSEKCEATCSSSGDPHYTTFDGLKYDFYGACSYYLVYNDNFTVVQEIGPCQDASEPATDGMYCTSKLAVKYEDETLVLQPGFKVTLNEKDANLPVSADRISASMATDLFLKVDLLNGLNLLWDGQNRIYVNAPPSLYEQTAGLCGTFNGKQMDDFTTPTRDIEADASSFAARWEVSGSCHKRSRRRSAHLPCESQPQKLKDAELLCSTLKLDIFRDCHEELDPTSYYRSCISDLCQCTQELELCLCPIIADYSLACTKKGIVVNWVEDITVCKPECSGGQVYQECRDPCTSSCAAIASSSDTCIQQCVQGCACVEGTATNAEGFCVAVDQCPCIYEDKEYLPASVTVQGSSVCTCQAARWQCRPGTLPELATLSSEFMIEDGDFKCLEDNNEEYTQCKESCPRTCQNMHLRSECKTEECRPGCKCRDGYLLDSESKKCVKESECGCVHGNKRYREGETIKQTCNLCTCSGGSWQCTMRECPGVCSVWGESHFKTFDGKIFDFQGDCEYVLSKGNTKDASYVLSVQNVPCGTSGITCSKSFTLELGPLRVDRGDTDEVVGEAESLQLSRDEPVPRTSLRSRFVVVESGLFVTVFTDIGLSLQWDRGTRIYITAQPRWRQRVRGLCGNFNDNQEDDFLTPSGGIPEATSSIFADSWKVHEFCPRPQTIEDACEIHPHRKSWAQQKCAILKTEAFSACHSEVPMEPYYERCVFDSCACDMGGDCECLCTAIAAYAQECNMHGVPVKWRSQELCPIQCEECATYDSCMPSCPKRTCENGLAYERIEETCSAEFCVEGCNPKPCPEGQIYNNGKEFKCIPEIECVVPCMELNGKIYNEGDRITDLQVVDPCQTCHCVRGSMRCTGHPCITMELPQPCLEGGWTPWVNTPSFVGGDYEVLTDPRVKSVLQNYCGLANMTEIECRVAETKQPYTETGQRVQCRLPTGLSCKDEDQKDVPCEDYEIRVFCDCGLIPTTEATTVSVTTIVTLPPVCEQTGWTAWMSVNVPNEQGEFETLDRLRVNHYFCEESMIENVECRARSSWKLVTGEDEDVICNSKVGLVCLGSGCEDYEVRVFCNCGVETTPAPVPVCVTGWTEYFNTDHPDGSETGDDESLDRIRSLREFCVGGTIEDIECKAIINDQLVDYKELDTFGLKCSKNVGFECNQFVRPKKCEDFTVRFYCACEPLPTTTTTTTTTTTLAPVTITPVPLECGWTPWINMDSPDFKEGDIEDLSTIQMLYKTCGGKDLLDIECRMARTHHKYSESLQNNLICDTERGFRCLNDDQTGKCYDYEIRLLCMYPWCYPPTTTPVPTTTTANPCGEGKVYDACAFHCGHVCSSLAYKLSEECLHALDGCVPGCRPVEGCQAPHLWRDFYTCVAKEDCFCTMQDENGTFVNIPPNEVIINGCEKCQCLENNMMCHEIPGCGVTEEPAVPRLLILNIVQEDCWTSWINLDKPDRGGGDLEVPSRIRKIYEYCQDPIKIECRTAISHQKPFDVGQIVTCDLHDGLICWNKDNKPEECYDYEIRFFCPCPSQTTTTVAPLPTLPPGPCVFGWTEWYNSHAPDGRGDYETVQSSRIGHSFCSNDMISAMQCRRVGKSEGDLQAGVTCDLDFGLMCNSELLYGSEQCEDYEIRFFCDCPTMAPATKMETLPPITTPAPTHLACAYWSEWINENHPSSGGGGVKGGKGVKGGAGSRGDTEKVMILRLKRDYDFCLEGYLSDIECRDAETDQDYTETGEKKLACSLAGGFRCRGRDQVNHRCRDYKIRYFCSCETSTTTTTVKPTTPEITVPPCNEFYRVVDGPAPLPDSRLRASSSRDTSSGPHSARLSSEDGSRSAGAWIAGKHNDMQFLEIDLGQIQPVYGVVTKGRSGHSEWVKSYKVLYSRDGDAYHYVQDQHKDKIFSGNYDSDSEVQHLFLRPFEARFVRIQPVTFYKAIAMRADILGCASDMEEVIITTTAGPPPCNDEMGMWNGNIRDYQISTSSNRNWSTDGRYARLNTLQTEDHSGGWVADHLDNKQYIQVNFMEPRNLTGVKTQGRDMVPQWVTAFYISYSQDGEKWNKIKDEGGTVIFPGNYDSSTTVITYFPRPIRARFMRIHPVFWENWIAMRFEVLGCYEQIEEEVKEGLQTTPKPIIVSEVCTEPMGFENYALPDTLIAVSSSNGPFTGPSRIRLNTHQEGLLSGGWIPADSDYMPRVYIDFYEVRNLTGIITQGLEEADRWVVSYKVAYSLDNVTWDFATDRENRDIVFSGNVNRNGEVLRLFDRMITARFLEIIILDYHNLPALRMEVLGCFIPYPVYTPPPVLQTTTEICVEYGPWISLTDPAASDYGDEEPIEQVIAASGLCRNPFEIECRTQVTKKDSSETGQVVSCDLSRGLFCKNAHQASYQCYNYEVRIKCWTCGVTEVTTPVPLVLCPEIPDTFINNCPVSCPPDYACDGTDCVPAIDCPCFRDGVRFKPSNVAVTADCQHCECVIGGYSRCEPINCPDCLPGQKPELDSTCHCGCVGCAFGTVLCPTSGECIGEEQWCDGVQDCPDDETGCPTLPPTTTVLPTTTTEAPLICSTDFVPDTSTCEMLSNVFETFDGVTYQYDICDHVLMKETNSGLYSVSVHKSCVRFCQRHLVIEVDGVVVKIGPGVEDVTVQDTRVSPANLWLVSRRFPEFEIKKNGNTIVFRSFKHNFDVTWDAVQDAKITVSKCLLYSLSGLCGLYNKRSEDDLTKPNGAIASGSQEFGDSWAIGSLEKCVPSKCPPDVMRTAIEVCNKLREDPFNSSCSSYVKLDNRIEACTTFLCECMQQELQRPPSTADVTPSKDVLYDFLGADTCKCRAYESFVEACEASRQRPVHEWRIKHDCSPDCPEGMEWQDCGPGCELTCDNYHQRSEVCGSACVPGCYCPDGLVRHHNRCVKPKMCQDCVCRGHGDPNYISFDGQYYAFQGICTYVLAQYQGSAQDDNDLLNFRILATNIECPEEPHTSCTHGLTIYWNGHVIEKFKNKPVFFNEKPLRAEDSPLEYGGISISYVPNKSTLIHIKEINLAVRYFDQMYGFNIELPAFFYFNKTEGLCGICNFIQSDDMYHRNGYVTEDVEDFAYSWLADRQESRETCELTRVPLPEPPPPGICNFTSSPCDLFLDPTLYSKSCQNDVTYSQRPEASVCRSKFQYAQQCCERGLDLVEWLKLSGCESTCPEGMIYECSSACSKTCDNYKHYRLDYCGLQPLYTCACPEGKVLKLGQCVDEIQCETCDAQGHVVGEVWREGACKTCECLPDLTINCVVVECPLPPACNDKETLQRVNRSQEECCDAYLCMPMAETTCPESPLEECPPGQAYVKDYIDGCPVYSCKCIKELCPPLITPLLDDGENYTVVELDCCRQYKVLCNPESCLPPPACSPGFKVSAYEGRCCYKYTCVPRNDVCVYQHKYDVVNGTQVRLPLEEVTEVEYEPGSSWQDGLCRKCSCVEMNGQFTYSCREEVCPNPNEFPDADKYYREEIHLPGACCSKYKRTACVVQGVKYEIGEEWDSPDGNPCKSYRCNLDKNGEAVRLEKTTICDTTCPQYAVYVEAAPESGKCCGVCKPIACEEDGTLYENGETWVSTSKPCFTAECLVTENGTRITYRGESCPLMPDNCAPENIRSDPKGCCTYCKFPTETCAAVEVPVYETRGFFGYVDKQRGFCSNDQVLRGLTKCGGQCSTESHYSDLVGDFHSVCNCCLPKESQNRTIVLDCEDGSKVDKVYMQPITCQCLSCSGNNRYLDALNQVEPYRK